jgi:hypothetical protein
MTGRSCADVMREGVLVPSGMRRRLVGIRPDERDQDGVRNAVDGAPVPCDTFDDDRPGLAQDQRIEPSAGPGCAREGEALRVRGAVRRQR